MEYKTKKNTRKQLHEAAKTTLEIKQCNIFSAISTKCYKTQESFEGLDINM